MRKENDAYHKVAEFKSRSISQQNNEAPFTSLNGLPKGNGEFCHIERIFRESGMFSFCGKEKVETADDVAYIFKELENASVENAFVVLVKENIPTIVHLGMGLFAETQVNLAAIKAAYDALGADQIYFVHNHPSGNLHCSRPDVRLLNVIAEMVGNNVLREGIIINTTSGKYGTFDLKGNSEKTNYPQLIHDEYPLKLYSFDKTVFSRDYDPQKLSVVCSSRDIAALISSQRLGNRQKVSYLILDHGDHIVGNLHTAFNAVSGNETKIANEIVQNTIRFGGVRAVLYGSYSLQDVNLDFFNIEVGRLSGHTVKLLDCIVADGLHTQSAIDLSLMEPTVEYKRESLQNDTNIYEMDDVRFRIEDNYTQEEQFIINQAKADGTYLKAPNGEDTNLSPELWVQVRTTAFKKWFGDWQNNPDNASRIIDKNREPMVVYHGSTKDFTVFDYNKIQTTRRAGFYFTGNKDLAKNYQKGGKLIEAFVNLRKPLNPDETKKEITKELFVEIANEAGIEKDMHKLYDVADSDIDLVSFLISANNDIKAINDSLYTVAKYDGIITEDRGLGRSYIAFSSNQIKSAIENIGTFSLDNDDIRFREEEDNISSFAAKYNLDEVDVRKYAASMQDSNLGGAAYAFHNIRRKLRLDSSNDSFVQFSNRFAPIKEKLYEEFGNIDKLRDEAIRITMEERNVMEAARKRIEEEAAKESERLREFQDMSDDHLDEEYFKAVGENNEPRMRDLVDEAARRKGYEDIDSDYQGIGAWAAPSDPGYESAEARWADVVENSPDVNIEDISKGYSPQPNDYFSNLRAYGTNTPEGKESAQAVNSAIDEIRSTGKIPMLRVYRTVPTEIKESSIRNADWVTPSRKYAEMHGNVRLEGKYRLMEQEVPADELWWDGNDINEWGFDDGKGYRYKNAKNNRKLNDLITRDDNGNIIPLSQRFDSRNDDVRFRFIGEKGAANLDRVEEAAFRLDNLGVAREMEYAGKEPVSIKQATGWERGADGLWRYETLDFKVGKDARLFHTGKDAWSCMLSDLNFCDTLLDAYPSLAGLSVIVRDGVKGGSFDGLQIEISGSFMGRDGQLRTDRTSDFERILNHEIQHVVQDIEGFTSGSSHSQFKNTREDIIRDLNFFTNGDLLEGTAITDSVSIRKALDKTIPYTDISLRTGYAGELKRVTRKYGYEDLEGLLAHFDKSPSAMEQYYRTAGEVEARNVESRMSLSEQQRRDIPAVSTEDVARSELIFLRNSFSESMYSSKTEIIPAIKSLANSMNASVYIIKDINELPDSLIKRKIESGSNVKGWFIPTTNSVNVYLPHISSLEDAQRTVFHEAVAHYGLRKMFGEHFDVFLDNVYNNAVSEIQGRILYATNGDPAKRLIATEEYLAKLAERGFSDPDELSLWKKIKLAFIDMLHQANVSLNFKLTDDGLRYILYKSYLNLTQEVSSNNLNLSNMEEKIKETAQTTEKIVPDEIKGVVLTEQQKDQLSKGKQILLENLIDRNGKPFSANVSYNFENNKPVYSFPEKQNQEFRMPNAIKGVELSEENKQQLTQGGKVYIEGMTSAKGTSFDAYVYIDREKKTLAFDFPEKKEKKKENINNPQAKSIEKPKKLGL